MDVFEILKPRFDKLVLKGFQKGWFNESKERLFAYAILSVKDETFEDLFNWHLDKRASSFYPKEEKKYHNYNEDGSYSLKGVEQLVDEDVIHHVSLQFYGMNHQAEWFVMFGCSYHEERNILQLSNIIEEQFENKSGFLTSVYEPIREFSEDIDLGTLYKMVSEELGRQVELKDCELIFSHTENWPRDKIPRRKVKQSVEQREFVGHPWLVGHLKQEEKSRINRAFETYINEAVFLPLIRELRILHPDEFDEVEGLYSENYPLIYPHSKDYVLAVVKVHYVNSRSRLYYYLYLSSTKQLFEWKKPIVHEVPGHHTEWILEDIKDLSAWGDEFSFHEPSVTMDDPNFWNEHVLKQEDGRYLFLQPIDISL